jgi:hypothetical protein
MLAFLVTLIKVIAPWVAAAVVIHYLNVYNEKKHPEFYNLDDKKTPQSLFENLEIGYPFELAFIMYISLIFSLGIIIGAYVDGQLDWFVGILGGAYMLLSLCSVLGTHVWKIWVKGEKIIYRSYIGIKHYYTFADITRITERLDGGYEFYSGKKKLFRIDNNLSDGSKLAIKLQVKQVPCDKAGMTIDKFTLKTRGVYKAVSAMSVGFFCWMVWVMIEQNETSIIFFRPMLALAVISLIIFIDLITDRFSVNGTRVTRRRGLIVKKFDISEIESTRLKKGLFGEKIEFYVKGKCIAKVSTNNQPYDLLDKRIRKEHILRKR